MSEEEHINEVLKQEVVRYSQVWEDSAVLIEGLDIKPDDHVLSIASAGCNALALLLKEPASVTAVDLNPAQTAIVHLKKVAIEHLEHAKFVELLGVNKNAERDSWGIYQTLREHLPDEAVAYWDSQKDIIDAGIIHCGRLEKYFQVFQEKFISRAVDDETLQAYLNMTEAEHQTAFFDKVFGDPRFVEAFRNYTTRDMIADHGRDHSQFKFVEVEDTGEHFYSRFKYVCTQIPAQHNFYLEYLLSSQYKDLTHGPDYLKPENYDKLRSLLPRLHIQTCGLDTSINEQPEGHFSKANLSDLFEYLSDDETEGLLTLLAEQMREGGRLAYWNLLVPRSRPESLADRLKPHPDLANGLWQKDRAFFYRAFHVEEVTRP